MLDDPFGDCSGGMSQTWRWLTGGNPPWQGCCLEHDTLYQAGGSRLLRKIADEGLRNCVAQNGHPVWAALMYRAVRAGGHPALPLPWRWGFSRPIRHVLNGY